MKKITYLLGAGASANALPLIKSSNDKPGLSKALRDFVDSNKSPIINFNSWDNSQWMVLNEIPNKCIEFGTPDLYAKFLVETGDNNSYKLLIRLMSNFFQFKENLQITNSIELQGVFDFRALTFLTVIAQNKKIPDNIRIISWNYDTQLEIAAARLRPFKVDGYKKIQKFTCWPNIPDGEDFRNTDPFLFHLNGVAGYDYSKLNLAEKRTQPFNFNDLDNPSLLSFAWEEEPNYGKQTFLENRIQLAKTLVTGTQILIVVGYSFPFFNRIIDDILLARMKPTLEKIYFQDPNLNGQQLIGQFNFSPSFAENIIHIKQTDNYHIPMEL